MDIYCLRIPVVECPCLDMTAWISMWISTIVWIIEDWHPKIMDIHVDIRGFLEIHVHIDMLGILVPRPGRCVCTSRKAIVRCFDFFLLFFWLFISFFHDSYF